MLASAATRSSTRREGRATEHELGGAHHEGALCEGAAPLHFFADENGTTRAGLAARGSLQPRVMVEERLAGLVRIRRGGARDVGEGEVQKRDAAWQGRCTRRGPPLDGQGVGSLDLHAARGDGAGLVEAEHVDAGERLDAVQLLGEDVLSARGGRWRWRARTR